MITNNKKYRIKWKHVNNATNNQNRKNRKRSWTECIIIANDSDDILGKGIAYMFSGDKNYVRAIGRYYSTKKAMSGMEPADQVDILESLENLPTHNKWLKSNQEIKTRDRVVYSFPEDWAEKELAKIPQEEFHRAWKYRMMYGKEKWIVDDQGRWKSINPNEEL